MRVCLEILIEIHYRQVSFYAIFFARFRFNAARKIFTTFWTYAIILGLKRFGIDDPWPHLSSVGG